MGSKVRQIQRSVEALKKQQQKNRKKYKGANKLRTQRARQRATLQEKNVKFHKG